MSLEKQKNNSQFISDFLPILLHLGKLGGLRRSVVITTQTLGEAIGLSQQSISRRLTSMENDNLIVRTYTRQGNSIRVTPEGTAFLDQIFSDLWMILASKGRETLEKFRIKGKVITGIGDGAYYMSRKGYQRQFESILGFRPFPGTLNLQLLSEPYLENFRRLISAPTDLVSEFKEDGRVFGKVFVWFANLIIKDKVIPVAIVYPDRTHHIDQLELICEEHIKTTYNVKDGDELEVSIRPRFDL
jgi:riboflavin kinase